RPTKNVFALPLILILFPSSLQYRYPFLLDSWRATNSFLPSLCDQYGVRLVCADPVTISSGMPDCGAKKRDTKSTVSPFADTITPLTSFNCSSRDKSATIFAISASEEKINR